MDKTDMDAVFMRRCLQLASLGRGHVSPNPMVGAVVVHRGQIIGGVSSVLRSTACRGECHKFGAGCRTVAGMYIVCFFGALFSLRENSSLCRLDCPKEDTEGRCRLPRSVPEGVGARCRPVAGGRYRSCYGDIGRGMQGFEPNFL